MLRGDWASPDFPTESIAAENIEKKIVKNLRKIVKNLIIVAAR